MGRPHLPVRKPRTRLLRPCPLKWQRQDSEPVTQIPRPGLRAWALELACLGLQEALLHLSWRTTLSLDIFITTMAALNTVSQAQLYHSLPG